MTLVVLTIRVSPSKKRRGSPVLRSAGAANVDALMISNAVANRRERPWFTEVGSLNQAPSAPSSYGVRDETTVAFGGAGNRRRTGRRAGSGRPLVVYANQLTQQTSDIVLSHSRATRMATAASLPLPHGAGLLRRGSSLVPAGAHQ